MKLFMRIRKGRTCGTCRNWHFAHVAFFNSAIPASPLLSSGLSKTGFPGSPFCRLRITPGFMFIQAESLYQGLACAAVALWRSRGPLLQMVAASGYRNNASGALTNVSSNGNYWTYAPNSQTNARNLNFNSGNVNPLNNNNRSNGFSVRPCRELE